ncbi:hypothetical protein [Thalassobellus sediminis]|uniref:hypothetical protein n=1 Tax=Thalassobellus sediminis TaxID=3367753 RepID=UPI0037A18696
METLILNNEERKAIIYLLNIRLKRIPIEFPKWTENSKSWKNEYYYPILTTRGKLEKGKSNFKNIEIGMMLSCVNEYSPVEHFVDDITGFENTKFKEPFKSIYKKIKIYY